MSDSPLVIGVDGGGTDTVAWLAIVDRTAQGRSESAGGDARSAESWPSGPWRARPWHEIIGRGTAGPSNLLSAGVEAACAEIDSAIDAAFADASRPRETVSSACLAAAGAGSEPARHAVARWAGRRGVAGRLCVTHDAHALLAASGSDAGIALVAGTGSMAWGRGHDGRDDRVGGWGRLLGDEGSAYDLASSALRCAARAADGRGPRTTLLQRLMERLGCARPRDLVDAVASAATDPRRLAALAPLVLAAAEDGDDEARRLVTAAAEELATMVMTLHGRLQLPAEGFVLAAGGGLLAGAARLRRGVVAACGRAGFAPALVTVEQPVLGAVLLAADAAR
ncbi:MAG: N-acetylglucosamine kinase [Planctomycetota bacterium]|jgi:N-acetylglucosamine kinase-like BadF-type ATPase